MTGTYCGVDVVQVGSALFSTPRPGSPYAAFGKGVGNSSGVRATFTFSATGSVVWGGQFTGCAQLALNPPKGAPHRSGQNWLRNDPGPSNWTQPAATPPSWTQDLVMYELNPRGFSAPSSGTGPGGNGAGTFAGVAARIPYLKELGITAVWLAGYCRANAHFFGIWSVYATERPDVLDEALGTAADFKAMIDAFHAADIKVFLDVVTHGVTFAAGGAQNRSQTGPNPFIAGNPGFFYHTSYPDGKAVGKWMMADYDYGNPGFKAWWIGVWSRYVLDFGVDGFRLDGPNGLSFVGDVLGIWDEIAAATKAKGKEIAVFGEEGDYDFGEHDRPPSNTDLGMFAKAGGTSRADACFKSVMFSCHDGGFDQGPGNYYGVRGSRAKLGYQGVFSYLIPVWYAGDESDLDPVYLPAVKKGCYSGGGGPGGWYYGLDLPSMWDQTATDPAKASMLSDTSRMLAIKKSESDVLHANQCTANVASVPTTVVETGVAPAWVPYARWAAGKAIIVCANPSNASAITLTLNVDPSTLGLGVQSSYTLQNLWTGTAPTTVTKADLANLQVDVPKDGAAGGGLAVLKLSKVAQAGIEARIYDHLER